ncbi:MAG: phosphatase [Bacteroidetes bacterium]|nr:phosphatase [Bacteroidota bacterium]
MTEIISHFKGIFVTEPLQLQQRLSHIKAYVFDWDGVFNNGMKDEHGSSPFSEVDSMGTNLLRYNFYLQQKNIPVVAVISGEQNKAANALATRERFHSVYGGVKYKADALAHLCSTFDLHPSEVAFVFDDVLDFSIASQCGVRIMVPRACNPLLIEFAIQRNMVDYLTACEGGNGAVREATELICGLSGMYSEALRNRMDYTDSYKEYLSVRQQCVTHFYTARDGKITQL